MIEQTVPPDALGDCALLDGLEDDQRREVVEAMTVARFADGEVLLQQGVVTHNVWVLLEGTCEVVKEPPSGLPAKAVALAQFEPYETFGEMTLFCDEPHCTSVWAKTDIRAARLRRAAFDHFAEQRPEIACRLACNVVNILSNRLRRMDQWLTGLLDQHNEAAVEAQWERIGRRLQQTFPGYTV